MKQNRQYLFNMSYLEVFGVLTGVGVGVSKFFRVGAGVVKQEERSRSLKNVTPLISVRVGNSGKVGVRYFLPPTLQPWWIVC